MAAQYAGEVTYMDEQIGRLLDYLRERAILGDALLVVTSDHGESFWKHGECFDHGWNTNESTMRAVGLIRLPGGAGAGTRVSGLVASIDVFGGSDTAPDEFIAGGEPVAGAAMCAEFYDLETLVDREVAFDGTLASADGDQVTFTVHDWFTGGSGDSATLNAGGLAPGTITSLGASLELGQRYLVSGSGGNVWSCGFTMTYDTGIANQWATVFSD